MPRAVTPLWFPDVGPGDAISLRRLAELALAAADDLGTDDAEIVWPAGYPPVLFLFTPATEPDGERRRLGVMVVERNGTFIPEDELRTA